MSYTSSVEPKPWTLLAYTVADDKAGLHPLDAAAQREIRAICSAADLGQMHVAVQVDFKRTAGVFRATLRPRKSRSFDPVNPNHYDLWRVIVDNAERSDLRLQKERRDLNAATHGVLKEFLEYGRQECPARRYVIFFYGHAFGPMGVFYDRESGERGATTLRVNALARAMESGDGPAEIVLFRDCFMDTLETAFQLQGVARFMIATQAEAPIAGQWPWLNLFASLLPTGDSTEVAKALVLHLAGHFQQQENRGGFGDVPYSLIDIAAAGDVAEPLKALSEALHEARNDPDRREACGEALERARRGHPDDQARPGDPALIDVQTMCRNLAELGTDPVAPLAQRLGAVVRDRVVTWHHAQKDAFTGISLYYKPVKKQDVARSFIQAVSDADVEADEAAYRQLALSQATGWHVIALSPLAIGTP